METPTLSEFASIPSSEVIAQTVQALQSRHFEPIVVATKEEALAKIKELIPAGASLMNGSSRTLEQIGFVDLLKTGQHGWNNLHDAVLAEKDPAKQAELRKQAVLSEYYLGSVHALAATGEMVIASNTGSQLPHIAFTSPNVILVIGAQKIVPTLADAMRRLETYVFPLEDQRMKDVGYGGSAINKVFTFHGENPMMGRTVRVILVNESLGF